MCNCFGNINKVKQQQAISTQITAAENTTVTYAPINQKLIENINQIISQQVNNNLKPDNR
jgi:translation elongation factor EF-Ts